MSVNRMALGPIYTLIYRLREKANRIRKVNLFTNGETVKFIVLLYISGTLFTVFAFEKD